MRDDEAFTRLSTEDRRRYVAQALGCSPDHPQGWPDKLVDDLVSVRLRRGANQFYIALGTALGACC